MNRERLNKGKGKKIIDRYTGKEGNIENEDGIVVKIQDEDKRLMVWRIDIGLAIFWSSNPDRHQFLAKGEYDLSWVV